MSAHTPGPWRVAVTVGGKRWIYADGVRVAKAASNPPADQREANERLIAAAPLMLAALRAALPCLARAEVEGAFNNCAAPNVGKSAISQVEHALKAAGVTK